MLNSGAKKIQPKKTQKTNQTKKIRTFKGGTPLRWNYMQPPPCT